MPGAGQSPYRDTRIARTQPTRANGRKERHPKKTVTRTVVVGGPAMVGSLCLGACKSHREEERLEVGVRGRHAEAMEECIPGMRTRGAGVGE